MTLAGAESGAFSWEESRIPALFPVGVSGHSSLLREEDRDSDAPECDLVDVSVLFLPLRDDPEDLPLPRDLDDFTLLVDLDEE